MDEFQELFAEWGVDAAGIPLPCSVRQYMGTGARGAAYATAVSRPGLPQFDQERLVRTSDGNEVLSSTRLYAPLADRDLFALHSLVTPAYGPERVVLARSVMSQQGLFEFVMVDLE